MKKGHLLILFFILLVSLFFRSYELVGRYGYGHDAELFSWIVKDIVVNNHPRLIGQLTSAEGIFIGPLFYYMLVPFFLMFNMDPIGALIPVTIIGVLTTLSYYFVFSKLFSKSSGLIAAFLHASLLTWVGFDRGIVPSTPTNLWVVWYFYTIMQVARGNFFVLPLLGLLIGLIWHIHIALLPTLLAVPFAFLVSKKFPNSKQILQFIVALLIPSVPLIIFELNHNFIQTQSLIRNFTTEHGGGTGIEKFDHVINLIVKNINNLFFLPYSLPGSVKPFFVWALLSLTIFLVKKKVLSKKEIIPLSVLALGVIGFFSLSSSIVSEYYIYSIEIIFVTLVALTLSFLLKRRVGKILVFLFLGILLIKNLYHFVNDYIYKKDYVERKAVVELITNDAMKRGFPCIGLTYITTPGENTGFRYFFYLKNQYIIHPSNFVPVYNIVIPDELSPEVEYKFGHIGIIPPTSIPDKEVVKKACNTPNTNLTDPLFGYVD